MSERFKPVEAATEVAFKVYRALGRVVIGTLEKIEPMDNPLERYDDESS